MVGVRGMIMFAKGIPNLFSVKTPLPPLDLGIGLNMQNIYLFIPSS